MLPTYFKFFRCNFRSGPSHSIENIHTHTHTHTHIHTYIYIYTRTDTHINIFVYLKIHADPSGRSLAGIVGSNPVGTHLSVVSVVCFLVEISATG